MFRTWKDVGKRDIPGVRTLPQKSRAPGTQKSSPAKKVHPDLVSRIDQEMKQTERDIELAEAMQQDPDAWQYYAIKDYAQGSELRRQKRRDRKAKYRREQERRDAQKKAAVTGAQPVDESVDESVDDLIHQLGGGTQPHRGGRKRKSRKSRTKRRKSRAKRRTRRH